MKKLNFGVALTGSFCTFNKAIEQIELLVANEVNVIPIMSFNAYEVDTRFGKAADFAEKIEQITGNKVLKSITEVEPIGPQKLLDILIVLPCTGNTLAKLANGIFDTPVTLAVKSHLRNQRPVLIGVSSNDALSTSAKNIGILQNYKHFYFIPMRQDAPLEKPFSIVCDFSRTMPAAYLAIEEAQQIQPIIF
ncbi:MAG: dipicolinate synthase subunit B [Clostridia bacterium]